MKLSDSIESIMSKNLITVLENDPLSEWKDHFIRRNIHHILVENDEGKLKGIISNDDVSNSQKYLDEEKQIAKYMMTPYPSYITVNNSIQDALDLFLSNRFRALPVVNESGELEGIVTPYDILLQLEEPKF